MMPAILINKILNCDQSLTIGGIPVVDVEAAAVVIWFEAKFSVQIGAIQNRLVDGAVGELAGEDFGYWTAETTQNRVVNRCVVITTQFFLSCWVIPRIIDNKLIANFTNYYGPMGNSSIATYKSDLNNHRVTSLQLLINGCINTIFVLYNLTRVNINFRPVNIPVTVISSIVF